MGTKPLRLAAAAVVDLPVVEASGVALARLDGRPHILVVGDRSARLGAAHLAADGGLSDWRTIDLEALDGWPDLGRSSQFEAIGADGGQLVALLREDPPSVLVADTRTGALRSRIALTAPPGSPLAGHWDDPSSRGEGLVLLRGGRLLVAKEKRPRALVEFCPPGAPARGLAADDFLDADEEWSCPDGEVEYVAAAMWRLRGAAKKRLRDISSLWSSPGRDLWLLSDKSRSIARLALAARRDGTGPQRLQLDPDGGKIRELDGVWRLPEGTSKPEGLVAVDGERLLVVMDTPSAAGNGLVLRRPA